MITENIFPQGIGKEINMEHCQLIGIHSNSTTQVQAVAFKLTPEQSGGLSVTQLKQIFEFVDSRLNTQISLDDMASLANLSRFHFARAFKKSVGEPPYAYVLRQRVERAKFLLKESKLQVNEVAINTGFKTASRFVSAFHQAVGVSPGRFRRL